ncbi:hypothetical protein BVC80_605g13 [Macleaya cordata]|uniref:Uncharacterized protein n=1 Tax=Macleaya cordata TaxID=56857 RepID=A0A200R0H7_MACCD|nr:hypothetical protein BVC80_605g13 [Macleaya cordata]
MLKRSVSSGSSNSVPVGGMMGWCWTRRRMRRRRGGTIRLGSKRRGLAVGSRSVVVRWRYVVAPLRRLKKLLFEVALNGMLIEGCNWSFPFVYPLTFPLI